MENFLLDRFSKDLDVVSFHKNFLKRNGFKEPKLNYLKIYRFLINAVNFLKDIDPDFLDAIGNKMYEDVTSLAYFMKEWEKKKLNYHKYFQEYLNTLPDFKKRARRYKDIKEKMASLQKVIKSTEVYLKSHSDDKKAKREYVDAVYEYSLLKDEFEKLKDELENKEQELEKRFKKIFEEFSNSIIDSLKKILNTKLFYFSALVFAHAKNSYLINKFAIRSGVDLSMKSMVEYFIRNYEVSGKNIEWVNYLKEVLKEIKWIYL